MQISLDEEMRQLVNDLKYGDWHETYNCAILRDAQGNKQAVLVVSGYLYEEMQKRKEIHFDYWTISDLFTDPLCSIAHGFPMDTASNRYVLAMLAAIRKHVADKDQTVWVTWETN